MSAPTDWIPLVTALTSLAAAVGSAYGAVVSVRNNKTLGEVKHQTDGLVGKLADSKLAQGIAEGHAAGLKQGQDESTHSDAP